MPQRDFKLPDLGEGLEDADIVRWLVDEGQLVELNQPLVEVDTAKALVEIPSPFAGKVLTLHASAGDTVEVGAPLVTFEVDEEEVKREALLVGYGVDGTGAQRRRRRLGQARTQQTGEAPGPAPSIIAPPPVRKLAAEMGVDLSEIKGSGPGGRITRDDVLAAGQDVASDGAERIALKGVRKLIAEKMSRSVSEIPHVTTYLTFDATAALEVRAQLEALHDTKITPLAVIAKAFVEVCKRHPKLNASLDSAKAEVVLHKQHHLGVATDTERGLIVPVIRDAGSLSVVRLASEIARLSSAAREGKAAMEELSGSTVTISNVGSFGAEFGTPIINYPESSILAVGVIEPRPVVIDGELAVRPQCTLSLSFDHRIIDGAEAGRALVDLRALLESPENLTALAG